MTMHTVPAGAGTARIDNVDVDQLLRDIGESSASTDQVDLFGLCLAAQRVLGAMQARQRQHGGAA